ncbi:hypothetical protein UlMin_021629 [Ulmus minor]
MSLLCVSLVFSTDSQKNFPSKPCPLRYGTAKMQEDAFNLFQAGLHEFLVFVEKMQGAQLQNYIDATLGSGNLREAIRLPPREYINEWLAVNTVDFFNQVNILHGTLTEFCTLANCPSMIAGPKYEYRWADGVTIKKPIEVSAPKYVEYLMDWIEVQLDEESIFPHKLGAPFPPNFQDVVKTIFKRLFWVYAHIYHTHFQKIVSLKEEAHLNTCFKHFVLFTWVQYSTKWNAFHLCDAFQLVEICTFHYTK